MDENNSLVNNSELSFFEKINKKILMLNISVQKYIKSSSILQNDPDVITALVGKNPNNIFNLREQLQYWVIDNLPSVFEQLNLNEKITYILRKPELMSKLTNKEEIFNIIKIKQVILGNEIYEYLTDDNMEYLSERFLSEKKFDIIFSIIPIMKSLPEEKQVELLTRCNDADNIYSYTKNFRYLLPYLSKNVIRKAGEMYLQKKKDNKIDEQDIDIIGLLDFNSLPIDLQVEFVRNDFNLVKNMSFEASSLFINNNPLIFMMMPDHFKFEYIKEHSDYIKLLDHSGKKSLVKYNTKFEDILMSGSENILQYLYTYNSFKSVNDVKLLNDFYIETMDQDYIKFITDDDVLLNAAIFNPNIFSVWGSDDTKKMNCISRAVNLYKTRVDDENLKNKMEQLKESLFSLYPVDCNPKLSILSKVLLNDKVMGSISKEEIENFIDGPNMELLIDIIAKTYGEDTRNIFKDRPMLSLEDIPNLDIFDKNVRENFGDAVIHNMLSYRTIGANILGDISRNPQKIQEYNKFSEIVGKYFEDTPLGLQNKLIAFNKFEEIIKEMDINSLTIERKKSLLLAINDSFMTINNNETCLIPLNNLDDLDKYIENRNRIYDECIQIANFTEKIQKLIAKRFFGMKYGITIKNYSKQSLSVQDMMFYYNVHSFILDERTQQSELFSKEELDQLEIVDIISKIEDPDILKEIYLKMSEREDEILSPTDFTKTREKIPMQYSKEFVDSLLTVDDIKSKINNGEEGISHELDESGIDIYILNGADFNLFIHTMGINNSELNISRDMSDSDLWKYFENGCSTISGSAISSEMLYASLMDGHVNFGFCSFPSEQIIGMAHHDAHISHAKKEINPSFDNKSVEFNYSDELIRKTAAQITWQEEADMMHKYNEVAIYRRTVNKNEITNDNYGGRVMPDYIVVYGEVTDKDRECAKSLGKDGKPLPIIQIDENAYGDKTYQRGHISRKENHAQKRESGDIVTEIKRILTNNGQNDRDEER